MLDLSLSRQFLKNKSLEAKVSVFNLLNQDLGVVQRAEANYLEQQITNTLGRYFMLSLTYALNTQQNPLGKGGMMRGG